jgi:valine dehydrogenase (NAD+)
VQVFDRIGAEDYEQVVYCHHRPSGLRAVIAVHSTALGPSLGGTRFHAYASEDEAVEDVLRLARAMTYKSAAAGLDLGGGKAVIIGDPAKDRTEALMRAYGRFVDSLGGRYITAEDVGTTAADMNLIRRETPYVTGLSPSLGGSGDPSGPTAEGVLHGMRATAAHLWGTQSLAGRHVVVSGVGKVGGNLVRHLVTAGARVTISDVDAAAVARVAGTHPVDVVAWDEAHAAPCDIFSPCALGGALSPLTIPALQCAAVVGSANNQLADPSCAELLEKQGVTYAPDFIVNAGGIISVADELSPGGYNAERVAEGVHRIFETTAAVLAVAGAEGVTTVDAAGAIAERRIAALGALRTVRTFGGGRRPRPR